MKGKKPLFLITSKSLVRLISRIKEGNILYGKVIRVIAQDKIVLRVLGIDVLAESDFRFEKGEELTLWVKESGFRVVLEALGKSDADEGVNILG